MATVIHSDNPCFERQGGLFGISSKKVSTILGIPGNGVWPFQVDGIACTVWDYRGSSRYGEYYTNGPHEVMRGLFGEHYVPPLGGA
jgi:hypothetical protein